MTKKARMPNDIRQECLWIVRGYDRRVKAYNEARREIIDGAVCGFVDTKFTKGKPSFRVFMPHSNGDRRSTEIKMEQLAAIEDWPETQRMRAVENAKLHVGLDLENNELRQRLTKGILLNCMDRHEYPFRYLNLTGMEKTDFYNRRDEFLIDIADYLGML